MPTRVIKIKKITVPHTSHCRAPVFSLILSSSRRDKETSLSSELRIWKGSGEEHRSRERQLLSGGGVPSKFRIFVCVAQVS